MKNINVLKEIIICFIFICIYALKYKTFSLKTFLAVVLIYILRIVIEKNNIIKFNFIKQNKWMHILFVILSILLLNRYWGLASTMILVNIYIGSSLSTFKWQLLNLTLIVYQKE